MSKSKSKLSTKIKGQALDIIRFIEFGNLERVIEVPRYDIVDFGIIGLPPLIVPPCNCSNLMLYRQIILPNNGKDYILELLDANGVLIFIESLNNFIEKGKGYRIHKSSLKLKPIKNATIRLIGKNKKGKVKTSIEIKKIDLVE